MKNQFFVVIGTQDGKFACVYDPMKLIGYHPKTLCCFGVPSTNKEKELLETVLRAVPFCESFHRFY